MELGFGFFSTSEELFSKKELEKVLVHEQRYFREYAETMWLEHYWKMKAMSRTTSIPKITSTISEMPSSITNEFKSKTESYALRSIDAEERLKHFHEKLAVLPEDFNKLITYKYLDRREDGKPFTDYIIYKKLNVSRSGYYILKKQALEELGRLLHGYN